MIGPSRPIAAAADGDRRRQRFHHRHDRTDNASSIIDRIHDFRDAMPLGLGREIRDQKGHRNGADHGHKDDEGAPGARRHEHLGVVGEREVTEKQEIVNQSDQFAENDGAEARRDSDREGEERQRQETDTRRFVRLDDLRGFDPLAPEAIAAWTGKSSGNDAVWFSFIASQLSWARARWAPTWRATATAPTPSPAMMRNWRISTDSSPFGVTAAVRKRSRMATAGLVGRPRLSMTEWGSPY